MSTETKGPTYNAYVVTKREGKDDWWSQIGSAWNHSDGLGLNLILTSLPLPGPDGECKIVLRPPKSDRDDDRQDNSRDDGRARSNGRQDNRRQNTSRRTEANR